MSKPALTLDPKRTQIEVACTIRGRPSYRWTTGYYVVENGRRLFPPMRRRDALAMIKSYQR